MQGTATRHAAPVSRARQKNSAPALKRIAWSSLIKWILLFVFLTGSVLIYLRQEEEIDRLAVNREQLERELSEARDEYKSIQELSNMVGSDQYIERVARDQLGLVSPEEIIFIH